MKVYILLRLFLILFLKGLFFVMKKIFAVLMALVLALSFSVTSFAAETKSGEISPAFADFDPATFMDMFAGMDLSALTGALDGMDLGAITGLFEGMDTAILTGLLGDLDLSGLTDILGGLDIGGLLGGGGETPTEAPTTAAPTTAAPTTAPTTAAPTTAAPTTAPSTGNNTGKLPQTGDNGMLSAFAVCAVAAGAFIILSKKKEA
jgi:LPXTG-motif cell wall-anchored protein